MLKRNKKINKTLKQSAWKKTLFAAVALLFVAGLVTVLTRYRTKPETGSAAATKYADRFGLANFLCVRDDRTDDGDPKDPGNVCLDGQASVSSQDYAGNMGAKTIRIPIRWSTEQKAPCAKAGATWTDAERLVCANKPIDGVQKSLFNKLREIHPDFRVLGVLGYGPQWARDPACSNVPNCQPANGAIYGAFAKQAAKFYGQAANGDVHDWELWNEPNVQTFFTTPDGNSNPVLYANMVKHAYTGIHDADDDDGNDEANVVVGGTASSGAFVPDSDEDSGGVLEPRSFWLRAFEAGKNASTPFDVGDFVDNVSHHPYTYAGKPANYENYESWYLMHMNKTSGGAAFTCPADTGGFPTNPTLAQSYTALNNLADNQPPSIMCIFRTYGHKFAGAGGTKKIWVTEYGTPVGIFHYKKPLPNGIDVTYDENYQITNLDKAFDLWVTYPWAGNFYFFRWTDEWEVIDWSNPSDIEVRPIAEHDHYMGITKNMGGADGTANRPGCTGATSTTPGTPTGRAKKAFCWLKMTLAKNLPTSGSPPTVSISADDTTVVSATNNVRITWTASGADSCEGAGGATGWTGSKNVAGGNQTLTQTAPSRTYTITCTNENGSASANVTVTVGTVPTLNFAASPSTIASGQSSTLTWTVGDANNCTASATPTSSGWTGSKAAGDGNHSQAVSPASTTTYNLACSNEFGSTPLESEIVTVSTVTPPTVNFTSNKTTMKAGESATLTWNTTNVTTCTAAGSWEGNRATSGSITVSPTVDVLYNLTCTGPGGSNSANTGIDVTPSGKLGDVNNPPNGDGLVNNDDLAFLIVRWGTANARCDLDNDGIVSHWDLSKLASLYGT
jgi:hypothetical protein